ncbi:MAG TPA: hypothetical protein VFZ46_06590 [Nitrososphaeraceae archaeon]
MLYAIQEIPSSVSHIRGNKQIRALVPPPILKLKARPEQNNNIKM